MKLEGMIENTLDNIKSMIESSNIIGNPVMVDGKILVPISKISFGYITGGGEYGTKTLNDLPYAGGSGGAVNVTPQGVLLIDCNGHKFIRLNKDDGENKWSELIEAGLKIVENKKKS